MSVGREQALLVAAASNSVIETIGIRPYRVGREARSDGGLRVVEKGRIDYTRLKTTRCSVVETTSDCPSADTSYVPLLTMFSPCLTMVSSVLTSVHLARRSSRSF